MIFKDSSFPGDCMLTADIDIDIDVCVLLLGVMQSQLFIVTFDTSFQMLCNQNIEAMTC